MLNRYRINNEFNKNLFIKFVYQTLNITQL